MSEKQTTGPAHSLCDPMLTEATKIIERAIAEQCECRKPSDNDQGRCLGCGRWINYRGNQ